MRNLVLFDIDKFSLFSIETSLSTHKASVDGNLHRLFLDLLSILEIEGWITGKDLSFKGFFLIIRETVVPNKMRSDQI